MITTNSSNPFRHFHVAFRTGQTPGPAAPSKSSVDPGPEPAARLALSEDALAVERAQTPSQAPPLEPEKVEFSPNPVAGTVGGLQSSVASTPGLGLGYGGQTLTMGLESLPWPSVNEQARLQLGATLMSQASSGIAPDSGSLSKLSSEMKDAVQTAYFAGVVRRTQQLMAATANSIRP